MTGQGAQGEDPWASAMGGGGGWDDDGNDDDDEGWDTWGAGGADQRSDAQAAEARGNGGGRGEEPRRLGEEGAVARPTSGDSAGVSGAAAAAAAAADTAASSLTSSRSRSQGHPHAHGPLVLGQRSRSASRNREGQGLRESSPGRARGLQSRFGASSPGDGDALSDEAPDVQAERSTSPRGVSSPRGRSASLRSPSPLRSPSGSLSPRVHRSHLHAVSKGLGRKRDAAEGAAFEGAHPPTGATPSAGTGAAAETAPTTDVFPIVETAPTTDALSVPETGPRTASADVVTEIASPTTSAPPISEIASPTIPASPISDAIPPKTSAPLAAAVVPLHAGASSSLPALSAFPAAPRSQSVALPVPSGELGAVQPTAPALEAASTSASFSAQPRSASFPASQPPAHPDRASGGPPRPSSRSRHLRGALSLPDGPFGFPSPTAPSIDLFGGDLASLFFDDEHAAAVHAGAAGAAPPLARRAGRAGSGQPGRWLFGWGGGRRGGDRGGEDQGAEGRLELGLAGGGAVAHSIPPSIVRAGAPAVSAPPLALETEELDLSSTAVGGGAAVDDAPPPSRLRRFFGLFGGARRARYAPLDEDVRRDGVPAGDGDGMRGGPPVPFPSSSSSSAFRDGASSPRDASASGASLALAPGSVSFPSALDSSGAFSLTAFEERSLRRRVSLRVVPLLFLCGFMSQLDRTNLAYAGMQLEDDLGLSRTVHGLASGVFFIGYLAQLPSNALCIAVGARPWLALILAASAVVTALFAAVSSAAQLLALRACLGIAESGIFPAIYYHLSLFYTESRLGVAYTWVATSTVVGGILGAPLAAWLLSLNGVWGLRGWQWVFLVEALPPLALALVLLFLLPANPSAAAFLTQRQRDFLVAELANEQLAADDDEDNDDKQENGNGNGNGNGIGAGREAGRALATKQGRGSSETKRHDEKTRLLGDVGEEAMRSDSQGATQPDQSHDEDAPRRPEEAGERAAGVWPTNPATARPSSLAASGSPPPFPRGAGGVARASGDPEVAIELVAAAPRDPRTLDRAETPGVPSTATANEDDDDAFTGGPRSTRAPLMGGSSTAPPPSLPAPAGDLSGPVPASRAPDGSPASSVPPSRWAVALRALRRSLSDPRVWWLGVAMLLVDACMNSVNFWLPQLLGAAMGGAAEIAEARDEAALAPSPSPGSASALTAVQAAKLHAAVQAALVSAIPFGIAGVAMLTVAYSAKARKERRWHTGLSMLLASLSLGTLAALAALGLVASVAAPLVCMCLAAAGIWAVHGPFFSWPSALLDPESAAIGFALIKTMGAVGGFLGPTLVGYLAEDQAQTNADANDANSSGFAAFAPSMAFIATLAFLAALMVVLFRGNRERNTARGMLSWRIFAKET